MGSIMTLLAEREAWQHNPEDPRFKAELARLEKLFWGPFEVLNLSAWDSVLPPADPEPDAIVED